MMKSFVGNTEPSLGVEEEFHLVDPVSGDLASAYPFLFKSVPEGLRDRICEELFECVLECRSPVCFSVDELYHEITTGRKMLDRLAFAAGFRLVASGSHAFGDWRNLNFIDSAHYRWVSQNFGYIAQRLLAFGLHVHVGVKNVDAALYVIRRMKRWVWPMLAFAANSPFFEGMDTGLASVRAHLFHSMPRTMLPPDFANFAELVECYEKLKQSGDIQVPGDLWWTIRPQPPLGTVEYRVCDLPTEPRRVAILAAVFQAATVHYQQAFESGEAIPELNQEYLDQNRWRAMRDGLTAHLIDPETGDILPVKQQLRHFFNLLEPDSSRLGTESWLAEAHEWLNSGSEAEWQRLQVSNIPDDLPKLELSLADRTVLAK